MYLEPIFKSEDIKSQLPLESKKFNTMERAWRRTMQLAFENPKVKVLRTCLIKLLVQLLETQHLRTLYCEEHWRFKSQLLG